MKRYMPIAAILVFVVALLGLSNFIWEQQEVARAQTIRELERHLVVYSAMPEAVNKNLAEAFHTQTGLRVQITTMTDSDIQDAIDQKKPAKLRPDLVITIQPVLQKGQAEGAFKPYASEKTETVPYRFKEPDGYWVGLWLDPMVFVVNNDYFTQHGMALHTWDDLLSDPDMRLAFPDMAATDMAGDFLCTFVETRGQEAAAVYFKQLQRHIPGYSNTFMPIVRRVAAGEADVGVADAITVRQYIQEQMPIRIIYPQDGTSYWLIGEAITKWCEDDELADSFIDWLYSEEVPNILRANHLRVGFASDVQPKELDSLGEQIVLFPVQKNYTAQGRKALQDWWIKSVRFGKDS